MFPTAHFGLGTLMFFVSILVGVPMELGIFVVIGSILPDIDFFLLDRKHFHRKCLIHTPIFWLFMIAVLSLTPLAIVGLFTAIGVFSHLILDTFDWGIMWLYPFDKKLIGGTLRKTIGKEKNFMGHYFSNKVFLLADMILVIFSVFIWAFILA